MVVMMDRSGTSEPEPTFWLSVRMVMRELIAQWRDPTPLTVRYLRCDGCGQVSVHMHNRRIFTVARGEVTAPPPEVVCDEWGHAQPRTVGDEIPADVTVTCIGRPYRRIRSGCSRRPCGREFGVPATASSVLCPWCAAVQPGPGEPADP
jgi:hypothetical protein